MYTVISRVYIDRGLYSLSSYYIVAILSWEVRDVALFIYMHYSYIPITLPTILYHYVYTGRLRENSLIICTCTCIICFYTHTLSYMYSNGVYSINCEDTPMYVCMHVQCMFRGFTVYVHVCEVCIIVWNSFASVSSCYGAEIISHNRQCSASMLLSYSMPNTTIILHAIVEKAFWPS